MPDDSPFARTDPTLLAILDELQRQEPIFHRPEYASSINDFSHLMAPDYWEIGASGSRYDRSFILDTLAADPPIDSDVAGWKATNFACRALGDDTYVLTYTLDQCIRVTRRSTIWRRKGTHWQILFHQGTVVSSPGEDNVVQAP